MELLQRADDYIEKFLALQLRRLRAQEEQAHVFWKILGCLQALVQEPENGLGLNFATHRALVERTEYVSQRRSTNTLMTSTVSTLQEVSVYVEDKDLLSRIRQLRSMLIEQLNAEELVRNIDLAEPEETEAES